jgi:hypothetical protein
MYKQFTKYLKFEKIFFKLKLFKIENMFKAQIIQNQSIIKIPIQFQIRISSC